MEEEDLLISNTSLFGGSSDPYASDSNSGETYPVPEAGTDISLNSVEGLDPQTGSQIAQGVAPMTSLANLMSNYGTLSELPIPGGAMPNSAYFPTAMQSTNRGQFSGQNFSGGIYVPSTGLFPHAMIADKKKYLTELVNRAQKEVAKFNPSPEERKDKSIQNQHYGIFEKGTEEYVRRAQEKYGNKWRQVMANPYSDPDPNNPAIGYQKFLRNIESIGQGWDQVYTTAQQIQKQMTTANSGIYVSPKASELVNKIISGTYQIENDVLTDAGIAKAASELATYNTITSLGSPMLKDLQPRITETISKHIGDNKEFAGKPYDLVSTQKTKWYGEMADELTNAFVTDYGPRISPDMQANNYSAVRDYFSSYLNDQVEKQVQVANKYHGRGGGGNGNNDTETFTGVPNKVFSQNRNAVNGGTHQYSTDLSYDATRKGDKSTFIGSVLSSGEVLVVENPQGDPFKNADYYTFTGPQKVQLSQIHKGYVAGDTLVIPGEEYDRWRKENNLSSVKDNWWDVAKPYTVKKGMPVPDEYVDFVNQYYPTSVGEGYYYTGLAQGKMDDKNKNFLPNQGDYSIKIAGPIADLGNTLQVENSDLYNILAQDPVFMKSMNRDYGAVVAPQPSSGSSSSTSSGSPDNLYYTQMVNGKPVTATISEWRKKNPGLTDDQIKEMVKLAK